MINQLSIKNFKSIKELNFNPKRINVFLGAPNVGKSNILEALSLFSVPYIANSKNSFEGLIRFDNLKNLFYDNITYDKIEVKTNIGVSYLRHQPNLNTFDLLISSNPKIDSFLNLKDNNYNYLINLADDIKDSEVYNSVNLRAFFNYFNLKGKPSGHTFNNVFFSSIRKYTFNKDIFGNEAFHLYLKVPHGSNINTIIQRNKEIFEESASFFETYGLELLYDVETNFFEIQKKEGKRVYKYPFRLMADTLQRIIFYLTVVESNKDTSILLEEPETHSYPPYTKMLAERIARNESNQFFITTHSPYLLYNLIENTKFEDRNIIITYYEDYQTKIKILEKEQIESILEDDIEVFFNLDKFLSNEK